MTKRIALRVGLLLAALVAVGGALDQGTTFPEGEQVYMTNCIGCHQANGQGLPDVFPPLAGHEPTLYQVGGRDYLPRVLLFGLQGEITVLGNTFDNMMPSWIGLGDEELASVVNFVLTAWGNDELLPADFEPFTTEEFAAVRELGLSAQDVYGIRQTLELP